LRLRGLINWPPPHGQANFKEWERGGDFLWFQIYRNAAKVAKGRKERCEDFFSLAPFLLRVPLRPLRLGGEKFISLGPARDIFAI